jgi:hypothetical protein
MLLTENEIIDATADFKTTSKCKGAADCGILNEYGKPSIAVRESKPVCCYLAALLHDIAIRSLTMVMKKLDPQKQNNFYNQLMWKMLPLIMKKSLQCFLQRIKFYNYFFSPSGLLYRMPTG